MTTVYAVIELSEEYGAHAEGSLISIWSTWELAEDAIARLWKEEHDMFSEDGSETRYGVEERTLDLHVAYSAE